ncbi:unnamed protein product, partial [marine sediment metagenome]
MYQSKFIACVMVDNEIVREVRQDGSDFIYLPFGTDYHLRLKNLDHRRAVVSITIDGEDVLDGSQLVVDGNSTTDLKGFLDSKSNVAHNAFRFIEKTEKVRQHRGERVDDGIVRVEVQFEEDLPQIEQTIKWPKNEPFGYPWGQWYPQTTNIWYDSGGLNQLHGQAMDIHYSGDVDCHVRSCSFTPTTPADGDEVGDKADNDQVGDDTN